MSLDTLLEAAKYLESSTKATSKVFSANARVPYLSNAQTQRNRTISESSEGERRRRPGGAGTRETHNKLEKNRRAHLKECFDILKSEVPNLEDKKTSNLNILRSALKYIQTLKKRERQFEVERDSLKIGNTLLKEKLRALKKELQPEVADDKSRESEDLSKKEASGKPVPPPISTLASVKEVGQILPVSVATQTTFSPVKSEAPNSLEDSSNGSFHSDSTESTQEDEDVDIDIDGSDDDDDDEKDVDVNVVDEVEEQHDISEVKGVKEEEKVKKEKEKRVEEEKLNSDLEGVEEDIPVARNGTLQKSLSRSNTRSSFDVESGDETSQEEFDYESFRPKIQSCARVSC